MIQRILYFMVSFVCWTSIRVEAEPPIVAHPDDIARGRIHDRVIAWSSASIESSVSGVYPPADGREELLLFQEDVHNQKIRMPMVWLTPESPAECGDPWDMGPDGRGCLSLKHIPEESRTVRFNGHFQKHQIVDIEIIARRVGSDLDPVLTILRPDKQIAYYIDDTGVLGGDIRFTYTVDVSGVWHFILRDAEQNGGNNYYSLVRLASREKTKQVSDSPERRVPSPSPIQFPGDIHHSQILNYVWEPTTRSVIQAIEVHEPVAFTCQVLARSLGIPLDIHIDLRNSMNETIGKQTLNREGDPQITLENIASGKYTIHMRPLADRFSSDIVTTSLCLKPAWMGVQASAESFFYLFNEHQEAEIPISIDRSGGYKGAISLSAHTTGDHPQSIQVEQNAIPADKNSTTLIVRFPEDHKPPTALMVVIQAELSDGKGSAPVHSRPGLEKLGAGNSTWITHRFSDKFLLLNPNP
ncbi:MAG: hypothetical protein LR011_09110 [Verrucomicrobia bacterium]|nr:hypothetical protein [Verrucomicrobiota bacterium]